MNLLLFLQTASSCFKASSSKSDRHLQFIPTNLHSQRMEVTGPDSSGNIHLLLLRLAVLLSHCVTPVPYGVSRCLVRGCHIWSAGRPPPRIQTWRTEEAAQQTCRPHKQVTPDLRCCSDFIPASTCKSIHTSESFPVMNH